MGIRIPAASPVRGPGPPESLVQDAMLWLNVMPCSQPGPSYASAGQVMDMSTYANHGSSYQALVCPGGLLFDNVDDRISFGTNIINPRLAGSRGLSAAILVRPLGLVSGAGRNQLLGINLNGSSSAVCAWFTDSGKLVFGGRSQAGDGFQSYTTASAVAADGVDIFLCGILDYTADRLRIWADEKLIADQAVAFGADTYQPGVASLADTIGAAPTGLYPLNGIIKAFALFRNSLDAGEVSRVREMMTN